MTENAPINEALVESTDLDALTSEHGDIDQFWVENGIANWRFVDGYLHRVDVNNYSANDEPEWNNDGPLVPLPQELTESEKFAARQMALGAVIQTTDLTDPLEMVAAAHVLSDWLIHGEAGEGPGRGLAASESASEPLPRQGEPDGP